MSLKRVSSLIGLLRHRVNICKTFITASATILFSIILTAVITTRSKSPLPYQGLHRRDTAIGECKPKWTPLFSCNFSNKIHLFNRQIFRAFLPYVHHWSKYRYWIFSDRRDRRGPCSRALYILAVGDRQFKKRKPMIDCDVSSQW